MNKILKIVLVSLAILLVVAAGFAMYAKGIAKGSAAASNPQNYITVEANGLEFAVNTRGEKTGTPVILLHGFPESAVMWDKFMDELAADGYYAIAPNQRGYSAGARPLEKDQYQLKHLASDVVAIADALGIEQFHLIGHAWGAGVGWQAAADYPARILSYAALSVPHIDSFGQAYREDPDQHESSAYIRFFQKPILPEFMLAKGNYEKLKKIWKEHDAQEIAHYISILSQENALTAALNWYRANFPAFEVGLNVGDIHVPTTFIWGNQDHALKRSGVDGTRDLVKAEYQFIEIEAGHWMIQEKYDELTGHLKAHLAKYR